MRSCRGLSAETGLSCEASFFSLFASPAVVRWRIVLPEQLQDEVEVKAVLLRALRAHARVRQLCCEEKNEEKRCACMRIR